MREEAYLRRTHADQTVIDIIHKDVLDERMYLDEHGGTKYVERASQGNYELFAKDRGAKWSWQ